MLDKKKNPKGAGRKSKFKDGAELHTFRLPKGQRELIDGIKRHINRKIKPFLV